MEVSAADIQSADELRASQCQRDALRMNLGRGSPYGGSKTLVPEFHDAESKNVQWSRRRDFPEKQNPNPCPPRTRDLASRDVTCRWDESGVADLRLQERFPPAMSTFRGVVPALLLHRSGLFHVGLRLLLILSIRDDCPFASNGGRLESLDGTREECLGSLLLATA